jgi:acetylornithine/succinyldiaminopimelate/putrescine aminotransferase
MSRTIELTHVGVSEPWESHIHSYCQNVDAIFQTASEAAIRDADARQYIDFLSGAGSLNYAQQRPKPAVSPHRISDA